MENFEQEKKDVSLVVNGNKLATGSEAQIIESISGKLPAEALNILNTMKNYNLISGMLGNSNVKVSSTSKGMEIENLTNDITVDELKLIQKTEEDGPESLPDIEPQKLINENSSSIAEIVIGTTDRKSVIKIMKKYSRIKFDNFDHSHSYFFRDFGLNISFDKTGIVEELTFERGFQGQTIKGLMIGDSIEKAIDLYGQPYMKSTRGAIWKKLAVFSIDNFISSIRLQK